MGRALADNGAGEPAAPGLTAAGTATAHDRRWYGPPFTISVAAASGECVGAQLNQDGGPCGTRLPWGVGACRLYERLGAADVDGDPGASGGLTGAEAVFTAARPCGVKTNHDESRERRGPGVVPDPQAILGPEPPVP